MANYTMADVKQLREQTGAGMMDVKKALDEADGDHEKAIEIIRLKGIKSLSKREGRSASAGLVVCKIEDTTEGQVGILVEVNSETDFVAKNEKFIAFANKVLDAAVAAKAVTVEELLAAPCDGGCVKDTVDGIAAIIGEKIEIRRMARLEGKHVASYMHYSNPDLPPQVGVMVASDTAAAPVAHDIAMHIAAYSPLFLDRDSVPAEVADKERATLEKITLEEGKPENMVARIVEGRMNGFFKENCLVDQAFSKDQTKTVGQLLKEQGGTVTGFVRFHVGA